ncbi:1-acyl-sn-glycerol-3-phosphate acyltransferase [Roseovarius sp. A21]|uniref:1-acyl-sn-glycerol-3-phosphate acyltransferase n=1 Tax=Roseovarius bejariae TaxID=2576383 RepID=A0A844CTB6_9RHOB|nr:lysophospholipid acyltransferase family protein [Roseovarius bejariae]MRU13940.1 1-acyl-sn-glycerol-3-phosphate acyltransferase [Roseovarius bejariae]
MSFTWAPDQEPPERPISVAGWGRLVGRGGVLVMAITLGVISMALIRIIEKPLYGLHRPWSPWITQTVCRSAFAILGMRHEVEGERMARPGAVVANHASWLDIFALNARKRIYFVSKSEVAGWPGIGLLAKITGTVFITRDPKHAKVQQMIFEERLLAGHKLLFFPEGTSTDGFRVLPFKSTLFQAFFTPDLRHEMHVQPVTVIYTAPEGEDARFYGWWGDMNFGGHLVKMLAARQHGMVKVVYHQPVRVDSFTNRKALSAHVEEVVRRGMPPERQVTK